VHDAPLAIQESPRWSTSQGGGSLPIQVPKHDCLQQRSAFVPSEAEYIGSGTDFNRSSPVCPDEPSLPPLPHPPQVNTMDPELYSEAGVFSGLLTNAKPPDIDTLERAMMAHIPVLIIVSASSPALYFHLPNDFAYSVMGYWMIDEIDVCSYLHLPLLGDSDCATVRISS
jgi:hypothetical protein